MIYGNRIMWPSITDTAHWECRKGFTINGYNSNRFVTILDSMKIYDERSNLSKEELFIRKSEGIRGIYEMSCQKLFESRFYFYQSSMPASSYRRTSVDFELSRLASTEIGAFVKKKEPKYVWLHDGIILSIEDAAHFLMAFIENPIGLSFNSTTENSFLLRYNAKKHIDSFIKYEPVPILDSGLKDSAILGKVIFDNFLGISKDLNRQLFADNLSILSLMWIIGHEDAHKYSGHLHHFNRLNICEKDRIYDELISTIENTQYSLIRRAAELEADTCSTMRLIDFCFDSEFLGVITDNIVPNLKREIWGETKESFGFQSSQRKFLLRLLTLGSILPLAIFDIAFQKNPFNNHSNYPSFITRAFNIMFTAASRAVDVTIHFPQHKVGSFNLNEFISIFTATIEDVFRMYKLLKIGMTGTSSTLVDEIIANSEKLGYKLFYALMAYHGQYHAIGLRRKIKENELDEFGIIASLIKERHLMKIYQIEGFQSSKKAVNNSRIKKTEEDIRLTIKRINMSTQAFGFLK